MPKTAMLLLLGLLAATGCCRGRNKEFTTDSRLQGGLVVILPGIEGESQMNHDIRDGLVAAGVHRALPIYRWGRPVPIAGPLLNQMDVLGNRLEARKVARMVQDYQDQHPGKPVYLIGHSGGGGMAVFAAEALAEGRKIHGLILLSPSISARYDLTKALEKTRQGIVNFYSKADVGFLIVGTTLAGNVDGWRGPAAGAVGFDRPNAEDPAQKFAAYKRLYQIALGRESPRDPLRAHRAATRTDFVAHCVAPWILQDWPAAETTPPAD